MILICLSKIGISSVQSHCMERHQPNTQGSLLPKADFYCHFCFNLGKLGILKLTDKEVPARILCFSKEDPQPTKQLTQAGLLNYPFKNCLQDNLFAKKSFIDFACYNFTETKNGTMHSKIATLHNATGHIKIFDLHRSLYRLTFHLQNLVVSTSLI